MTESVKNPKRSAGVKKKNSFSSRFSQLDIPLHGVRLPSFEIEDKYINDLGLDKGISTYDFLRELCLKRFRFLGLNENDNKDVYIDRIKYELKILQELDFVEYILLVWKVVVYCRENDIPLGLGRGSAAGSMVLYLLQITQIDPVKYDLFFERFVSKARAKKKTVDGITYLDGSLMCDVDVDVCYYRRQEVLQYLKNEFAGSTSKILTLNTLSGKLVMKECGKVAGGKEESEMNGISGLIPKVFGKVKSIEEAYEEVPQFAEWCDKNPKVYKIALKLSNLVKNKGSFISMTNEQENKKPWGKWLAFVAIGLITISLISFSNSMDDIEDLVDPGQNNSGIIGPNSNKEILLEDNRIYTILRIVENINDEAELDLEITNSDDKIMDIDEPTWMQPQRTGEGGSVIMTL